MNKERRKQIEEARKLIEEAFGKLEDARSMISDVMDAEQDAFDALPESFQDGERGGVMQEAIDNLAYAIDDLESIDFDSVYTYLEEASA